MVLPMKSLSKSIPPLCIVDYAVRNQGLCDDVEILLDVVARISGWATPQTGCRDIEDPEDLFAIRKRLLTDLWEIFDSGDAEEFFNSYLEGIGILGQCTESDYSVLFDQFFCYVGECGTYQDDAILRNIFGGNTPDSYRILQRECEPNFGLLGQTLAPLLYWIFLPFYPLSVDVNFGQAVRGAIERAVELEPSTLLLELCNIGITVRPSFLAIWCLNDTNILFATRHGVEILLARKSIQVDFELAAFQIDEKKYLRIEGQNFVPFEDSEGDFEISNIQLKPEIVRQFFINRGYDEGAALLNWSEVAIKIALYKGEGYERTIQGIGEHLHAAVVGALANAKIAMNLADLQKALHFEFQLTPDMLGPGCVMAYSRHVKFLENDSAYYVLSDWVETDTEKRGRISRDRIVTPFREKNWNFTWNELRHHALEDPMVRMFKLFSPRRLAPILGRHLPDKPLELYFQKKIEWRVRELLKAHGKDVGREYFVLMEDINGDYLDDVIKLLRSRLIQTRLRSEFMGGAGESGSSNDGELRLQIEMLIDDPSIRRELLSLVGEL